MPTRSTMASSPATATATTTSFAGPPKGFFVQDGGTSAPVAATSRLTASVSPTSSSSTKTTTSTSAAIPITRRAGTNGSISTTTASSAVRAPPSTEGAAAAEEEQDDAAVMLPSSVPSKGRRRESLGAQMRKGINGSLSTSASNPAAGIASSLGTSNGGIPSSFGASSSASGIPGPSSFSSSTSTAAGGFGSRPIGIAGGARARSPSSASSFAASGRYATSSTSTFRGATPSSAAGGQSGVSAGDLSTSFGTAAEALSLSLGRAGPLSASSLLGQSEGTKSNGVPIPGRKASKSKPSPGAVAGSAPSTNASGQVSLGHSHFGQECFGPSSYDATLPNVPPSKAALAQLKANSEAQQQNGTNSASSNNGDAASEAGDSTNGMNVDQLFHKCESCAKVYRHPSCLIKHRWEHTVYWKEASKFLLSKHQQVQLLEAAAILVGMDSEARSLPEEKALWPAAVSPPESGLLGSEVFNYDKLMEGRRARLSTSRASGVAANGSAAAQRATSPSMSPLNNLSQLHLGGATTSPGIKQRTPAAMVKKSSGGRSSQSRAGSADTVPEEDLMEDDSVTTRSSLMTGATRTESSTGRSGSGRSSSSNSANADGDGDADLEEEDDDETDVSDDRDRSPPGMSSGGGDVVGTFEMEE